LIDDAVVVVVVVVVVSYGDNPLPGVRYDFLNLTFRPIVTKHYSNDPWEAL
jgi:hypothetical protein